ncbi:MAG: hypothetical protein RXR09_05240 [Acidilobus sp.]
MVRLTLRQPPRIKVLEAAGAIADGRVQMLSTLSPDVLEAVVTSSEGDRRYHVKVVKEGKALRAYSDDNGTKLRGYVGYPIISVLMLADIIKRDPEVEQALKGIDWRRLNETYKKYAVVEDLVLRQAEAKVPRERVEAYRDSVMRALRGLRIEFDERLAKA